VISSLICFHLTFEHIIFSFLTFEAKTHNNIATLLGKQGRRKEALKHMKSTLETLRERLPPTHPEIAASYNNIGTSYYEMEDYSNALVNYEKCRDIQQASLPSQHPDLARTNRYIKRIMSIIQQSERTLTKVRKIVYSACSLLREYLRNMEKFNEVFMFSLALIISNVIA